MENIMKRILPGKIALFISITFILTMKGGVCFANQKIQISKEDEISNELNNYLQKLAAEDKFSGAVLVARNGQAFYRHASGMADKKRNIPNTIETKFNLGSMNKMFTAVAIAQLAERGKLSFNDTISKHLPEYPNQPVAEKITIHQLLTHTSGLGDYLNEKFYTQLSRIRTIGSLLPFFVDSPLLFEPGQGWEYSNAGFVVLGLIIEKVSGESYFDYVRRHIFRPAGMMNTDSYEADKNVSNRAIGYMRVNDQGEPDSEAPRRENTSTRPIRGSSAGGGYSTISDMLRFHIALSKFKLVSRKYTEIITTGKVKVPPGQPMNEYAYGFTVSTPNSRRIVGHGGASLGIAGKLEMYPELGYTVVILTNYDLSDMIPVVMKTRALVLKQ
jgi:CubicO group peptidase (beta-lactamase class C family)